MCVGQIKKFTLSVLVFHAITHLCAVPLRTQQNNSSAPLSTAWQRLPLDPLTPEENASAEHLARNDVRVKELLGEGEVRLVSIETLALKPEPQMQTDRLERRAKVILFRPVGEVGVQVVVNLQHETVEDVKRVTASDVPMTVDDLKDAFQLALRDSQFQKAFGSLAQTYQVQIQLDGSKTGHPVENAVTGLPVRSQNKNDPCSRHRCIELFFRRGRAFLSEPTVVVDLSAKAVYLEERKHK
jgi:Cu2+-containing amine oxidase